MNLTEAISFSELFAGGPGSGCRGPNCGRPIGAGDRVRIQKPITVWNTKTGNNDTFQPGTRATVLNVLPKVANSPQMISVQVKPTHQAEYMKMDDVTLHRAATSPIITPEPVPKSQIKQQYKSNDGAIVTVIKTPNMKEYSLRTLKDLANQPSRFKGKFKQLEGVINGADGNKTRLYDTTNVPARAWKSEGPSAAAKPGVTLWVERYADHVNVREQSYLRWSTKSRGAIEWKYNNIGQAFGMLKQRYGISIPLSKERF